MEKIIGYKGFDRNLKCRGFQYEIDKEYHMDGKIECCSTGFHLCTDPRDVFRYYAPGNNHRFCLVEGSGTINKEKEPEDSKIAVSDIKIITELSLHEMHIAIRAYINEHTTEAKESTSGDYSSASTSGNYSSASTSGDYSSASTSGYESSASTSGDYSSASTSGYESSASTSGKCSGALAVGTHARATVGEQCLGVAVGRETRARGAVGAWLVLSEAHTDNDYETIIDCVKCAKVDGKNILADTWYMLKNGHFVKVEED